jgi:starch phosphorylase
VFARFAQRTAIQLNATHIEEGLAQRVRMAPLAIVGGHAVNGVVVLHTDILKTDVFQDFYEMWP